MRESAAALLADIWHLVDSIQRKPRFGREFDRVYADITTNLERLHLDISEDEADFYHAVSALLLELRAHIGPEGRRGRIRLSDQDRDQWVGILAELGSTIAGWVRAPDSAARNRHADFLAGVLEVIKTQGLEGWRVVSEAAQVDVTERVLERHRAKRR
jgi:ribosome-associated translation inhibitor RaiA